MEEKARRETAAKKSARDREAAAQRKSSGKSSGKGKGKGGQKSQKSSGKKGPRNPYMFEKLEKRIMELEGEKEALNASLATEAVYSDPTQLRETQFRLAEVEAELETSNEEWLNWESA